MSGFPFKECSLNLCAYPNCECPDATPTIDRMERMEYKLKSKNNISPKPNGHDCDKEFVYSFDGGFCRVCGKDM